MTTLREGIAELAQERPRLLGVELRRWRNKHGMTQKQAADWVEVSRRTWIRYENNERPVPRWLKIIVGCVPATIALRRLNEREGLNDGPS